MCVWNDEGWVSPSCAMCSDNLFLITHTTHTWNMCGVCVSTRLVWWCWTHVAHMQAQQTHTTRIVANYAAHSHKLERMCCAHIIARIVGAHQRCRNTLSKARKSICSHEVMTAFLFYIYYHRPPHTNNDRAHVLPPVQIVYMLWLWIMKIFFFRSTLFLSKNTF